MARIRSIKPEFFTDEDIASLPPLHRLAFIGLWTQADKAGRLENRPARLKVHILPYDDVDFGAVISSLAAARFVIRYSGPDGRDYLQVRTFEKHQRPRDDEKGSELPEYQQDTDSGKAPSRRSDESVSAQSLGKERNGSGTESLLALPTKADSAEASTANQSRSRLTADDIVGLWNQLVTSPIPQVTKLTADRRSKINARLRAYPDADTWRSVIAWVNTQDWCRAPGRGDHPNWTASVDWLCKADGTVAKCLERMAAEKVNGRRQTDQPNRNGAPVNTSYHPATLKRLQNAEVKA